MSTRIAVVVYLAALVVANLTVAAFGPVVAPINAFLLIGLDLALRDHLHERWAGPRLWPRMFALIAAAGAVSFALNPAAGKIAVASVVAFMASNLVDAAVYRLMRRRAWLVRSNGSNVAGAAVDSVVFPTMAFGGLMPEIVAMQFAAKVAGGALWTALLARVKSVRGAA